MQNIQAKIYKTRLYNAWYTISTIYYTPYVHYTRYRVQNTQCTWHFAQYIVHTQNAEYRTHRILNTEYIMQNKQYTKHYTECNLHINLHLSFPPLTKILPWGGRGTWCRRRLGPPGSCSMERTMSNTFLQMFNILFQKPCCLTHYSTFL